jgi:molecular chaperone DnaK (HSP70)
LHDDFFDILGDSSIEDNDITNVDIEEEEGVAIRIQLSSQDEIIVTPLQVTTIILRAIQDAAIEYLTTNNNKSKKIQPPGLLLQQDGNTSQTIPNCVIGVPAHYSHAQRAAIRNAARKAGFSGHVSVMTESTAAAMAYGLFVSPMVSRLVSNNNDGATTIATTSTNNSSSGEKNILVFDMGGGTTDVTIATINFGTPSVDDDNVRFHVVATACDSRLGGDDVDELLAQYIWKLYAPKASSVTASQNDELTWNVNERRELISECRRAKEELCCSIDDKSSNDGMRINIGTVDASIIFQGKTISISTQEFNSVIQPIVDRAELVIQDALSTFKFRHDQMKMNTPIIHEVVLVGGSTHIPTVRTMLRRIFPPPIPSELCTSISAESAVAQGLAIQAALLSGLVPLWELRNAMMMDVLPHSIGVWISPIINMNSHNDSNDAGGSKAVPVPFTKGQIINPATNQDSHQGYYVPILDKDAPLPAKGNAAFTLADVKQPGVTVIAVEQIGPGDIFQCMGVFDFLLYRLEHNDDSKVRQVKIGMALEESGEFTVSIFDEKDPDHRDKRRRYLIEKALLRDGSSIKNIQKDGDEHLYDEDEERIDQRYSGTEISLAIICVISFVLYVATRIAFSNASSLEVCANPG